MLKAKGTWVGWLLLLCLTTSCEAKSPIETNHPNAILTKTETSISKPVYLEIPKLALTASIEAKGLLKNGQMAVPDDRDTVAWYAPGAIPGQKGNAVMAGHVDDKKGPAVFYYLNRLTIGDFIHIQDKNGVKLTFVVTKKIAYDRHNAPIALIFGSSGAKHLNLITCTGSFNRKQGTHEKRLVVYTTLLGTTTKN
ncbi:class F sortase [Bacillus songklensis]|uniref:Class F sortase n=1 Tax=Bacillus songklensis TaxID=1069116 RepID=A0ABV8B730_9BACI